MLQPKDTDWLNGYKKKDPYICCLQETHFRPKDTCRLKVRGWKNIFHANGKQKKAGVPIFTSDKIDLKIKKIKRDNKGHYIMIRDQSKRKHNNCKYLCTQHRNTSIHKTNTNRQKKEKLTVTQS